MTSNTNHTMPQRGTQDEQACSDGIQINHHPRRFGIRKDRAVFNFGNEEEFQAPRSHEASVIVHSILSRFFSKDPWVRLVRLSARSREDMRRHPEGQFAGTWHKQWGVRWSATPRADLDTPLEETNPILVVPPIRPRGPHTKGA